MLLLIIFLKVLFLLGLFVVKLITVLSLSIRYQSFFTFLVNLFRVYLFTLKFEYRPQYVAFERISL